MERRTAVLVAVTAALVVSVTTAIALTVSDDELWSGHRDGHMSSQAYQQGNGLDDRQAPGPQAPAWMVPVGGHGTMFGAWPNSEYAYLVEMVAHHEEAVAAAQQLERSHRPEMRAFGAAIISSQSTQIDQMLSWLADWYPSGSGPTGYRPMMRDLGDLSGDRLDQVFVQDMIGHHMAAVMMSQQVLMRGLADHEQVEALAVTIRDEQHREILQMQQWLRDWFGDR
jgi:uncharacterized protein (DUF305 family)